MRHYCTYFDINYLSRGLALYESLKKESSTPIKLWILCMDSQCYNFLCEMHDDGIVPISINDLEVSDPELYKTKNSRSLIEYYFTCTPCLPLHILKKNLHIENITYLDSDLYFFSDPEEIFKEIGIRSISITPHRYSKDLKQSLECGKYNVSFIFIRRDESGLKCINWWREKCIEWCYDKVDNGKYADQGYLDQWPTLFDNIAILNNPGVNLAIWNVQDTTINLEDNILYANDQKLVFYHFHLLQQVTSRFFIPNIHKYKIKNSKLLISHVYQPHVDHIYRISKHIHISKLKYSVRYKKISLIKLIKLILLRRMMIGYKK